MGRSGFVIVCLGLLPPWSFLSIAELESMRLVVGNLGCSKTWADALLVSFGFFPVGKLASFEKHGTIRLVIVCTGPLPPRSTSELPVHGGAWPFVAHLWKKGSM